MLFRKLDQNWNLCSNTKSWSTIQFYIILGKFRIFNLIYNRFNVVAIKSLLHTFSQIENLKIKGNCNFLIFFNNIFLVPFKKIYIFELYKVISVGNLISYKKLTSKNKFSSYSRKQKVDKHISFSKNIPKLNCTPGFYFSIGPTKHMKQ